MNEPSWVRHRATSKGAEAFKVLCGRIESDVSEMNELLGARNKSFRFEATPQGDRMLNVYLTTEAPMPPEQQPVVSISVAGAGVRVDSRNVYEGPLFIVETVWLPTEGRWLFQTPDDRAGRYEVWQVSHLALEQLFFHRW